MKVCRRFPSPLDSRAELPPRAARAFIRPSQFSRRLPLFIAAKSMARFGTACTRGCTGHDHRAERPPRATSAAASPPRSAFGGARGQWLVRLRSGALAGRERFVPEASMQLSHCRLAPEAKLRSRLGTVPAQGAGCGRGLVAAEPCAPGQTLFEEAPFLLAPHNATHMWSALAPPPRDRAARARRRGARAAAAAFGELSPGPARDDARRRALRAAAGAVVDEALAAAVDADAAAADAAAPTKRRGRPRGARSMAEQSVFLQVRHGRHRRALQPRVAAQPRVRAECCARAALAVRAGARRARGRRGWS